jgi:putative membrane protein
MARARLKIAHMRGGFAGLGLAAPHRSIPSHAKWRLSTGAQSLITLASRAFKWFRHVPALLIKSRPRVDRCTPMPEPSYQQLVHPEIQGQREEYMRRASIAGSALALALACSLGGVALAQAQKIPAEDQEFLTRAIQSGEAEVAISNLALEKSLNDQVRKFAERMVKDHTAANQRLMSLEEAGGRTLPKEMDQKHEAMLEKLSQLSGDEFDRQYMQGQVQDHQAAVKLFTSEATKPSGPVDALAGELLPALQQHLQMAEEISKSMA